MRLERTPARYSAMEARLSWPMLVVSVALLPVLLVQLLSSHLTPAERTTLDTVDVLFWLAFAAEYIVLLALAPSRARFFRTHLLELVLVVVPMLRPLRVARAVRVARALRVSRVGAVTGAAIKESRRSLAQKGLLYVGTIATLVVIVCALLIYDAEKHARGGNIRSLGDALWWASVTVTTIGYGDHFPVTAAGRTIAVVLAITGVALVGTVTAAVAAWFVRAGEIEERRAEVSEHAEQLAELASEDIDLRHIHRELAALSGAVANLATVVAELRAGVVPVQPGDPATAPVERSDRGPAIAG